MPQADLVRKGPPVYRPASPAAQPKPAAIGAGVRATPQPPPVYRPAPPPQAVPSIQPKSAGQPPNVYQMRQMPAIGGLQQIRVVGAGGAVAGSVDLRTTASGAVWLSNLEVRQPHRNQGLGGRLVQSALQAARSRGLSSVRLEARPAGESMPAHELQSFYGKAGFRTVGMTSSGTPIMVAGTPQQPRPATAILRKAAPGRAAVVQRAWSKPVYASTAPTKQLTDADFPTLGNAPITTPINISVKSDFQKLVEKPVDSKQQAPVDDLAGIKGKILAWDRSSHDGCKMDLSEDQISRLTAWAKTVKSKSGKTLAFNVARGEGSGDYAGKDQVKIISIHGGSLGADKQPTYHITLKV
jgi:ribosomal protein S18 acetylase RimI-like enzyme